MAAEAAASHARVGMLRALNFARPHDPTSKDVGDKDHLKFFADEDVAERWFARWHFAVFPSLPVFPGSTQLATHR